MEILNDLNTESKIAIASAIIALISIIISLRSNHIANKTYRLSKKQDDEMQPDFNIYYNEGFRFIVHDGKAVRRLLLFHITLRNKSRFRNTFKSILQIEYIRENDSVSNVIVEHTPQLQKLLKNREMSVFPVDIELEAKTSATKWIIFEQPEIIDNTSRISKYEIKFSDLSDNKSLVEALLIKNIEDESVKA